VGFAGAFLLLAAAPRPAGGAESLEQALAAIGAVSEEPG
jgi:hypothetical protein